MNLITGKGSRSGQWLLDHPDLDKLAFTGSTEVGHGVYQAACDKLIPVTLGLGGKSANIVFDDADLQQAIDGACKASSSIRARSAVPVPVSLSRKASLMNLSAT